MLRSLVFHAEKTDKNWEIVNFMMTSGIVHYNILVNIIDYENQLVSSTQFLDRKYPEFWIYFDTIHHMSAKRVINVLRCTIDCSFFLKSC